MKRMNVYLINFYIALVLSATQQIQASIAQPPISTPLNYWEEITSHPSDSPCAAWMKEIATHITTGTPTGINLKRNAFDKPVVKNPQYRSVQEACDLLFTLQDPQHPISLMHSIPLLTSQKKALSQYLENRTSCNLQTFVDSMHNWSYKDIEEITQFYLVKNSDYGTQFPPFPHWFTELFDIRIANLPYPSLKSIINELGPAFVNDFFNTYFKTLHYCPSELDKAMEYFLNWVEEDINNNSSAAQQARLNLQSVLQTIFNKNKKHYISKKLRSWVKSLQNDQNTPITSAKALIIANQIDTFINNTANTYTKLKQLHGAQRLLKNWNARNFELLGSSDTAYYAHQVYGKLARYNPGKNKAKFSTLNQSNTLVNNMSKWNYKFYQYPFPTKYFQFQTNNPEDFYSFQWINSNDATNMIIDFFSFMKENFSDSSTQQFYNSASTFNFQLIYQDPSTNELTADPLSGSMSEILSYGIAKIGDLNNSGQLSISTRTAVYQILYQMLLTVAITDNKFAQELLSYNFPIFTTSTILDAGSDTELKYNPMGYLLNYVRSILLSIMRTSPEFIDFITTYFPITNSNGIRMGEGHCRMYLAGATASSFNTDFSTSYYERSNSTNDLYLPMDQRANDPIAVDNLQWIKPFQFTDSLKFLATDLYTLSLDDIANNAATPPTGLQLTKKLMDNTSSLNLYTISQTPKMLYYPAITKKIFQQMQNEKWNLETLLSIDQNNIENAQEYAVADKIIRTYKKLLNNSDNPEGLKQYLSPTFT